MITGFILNSLLLGGTTTDVWLVHRYDKEPVGPYYRIADPDIYSIYFHYTEKDTWFTPMEYHWIGIDPPVQGDVYGIGCNADGTYMLITEMEPLDYPGVPMMIPGDYPHESMEVTLIDKNGNFVGKVFESEHLPQHLIDDQYFIRTTFLDFAPPINRIVSAPADGQPIPDELWEVGGTYIDGVVRAYPCTDTVIYSSEPFVGLMRSNQQFITTPNWTHIEPLGDGFFAAYKLDRGIDLINCDGNALFSLPTNSFVSCLTSEGFAARIPDDEGKIQGVLLDPQGEVIGEHPFGIEFQTMPGHRELSYGFLEEEKKVVLWNNETCKPISLPYELSNIEFPEDKSGVFQFSRKIDPDITYSRRIVGLMNPDTTVRFQMRSSKEPDIRWGFYGPIVRGAAMYQAHHHMITIDESGTHVHDEIIHEYLINRNGEVLWKSPGAPIPEIEIMNIED